MCTSANTKLGKSDMRQALHIFRKDVRHLWPEISIAVLLAASLGFAIARQRESLNDTQGTQGVAVSLLTNLLPLAWAVLIARLIHSEPPASDRSFWLTRPYSRASLLAAKALAIVAFVNLPKLVSDMVVLRVYGFSITTELGGLLWTQVLLTGIFVLPIAALCTVTTGFVQLLIVVFALCLPVIGSNMLPISFDIWMPWFALEWTRLCAAGLVIAAAALAIVVWQYTRRKTTRARLLAGAAVVSAFLVLLLFPWKTAFALQSHLSRPSIDASAIHVGYDSQLSWAVHALVNKDKTVELQVPLRVTGVPDQLDVVGEGISATMEVSSGEVWRSGREPRRYLQSSDLKSFFTVVDYSVYERIRNHPIHIRGSLYLTLYGNRRSVALPIRNGYMFQQTPGVGLCAVARTGDSMVLTCRSTFGSKPDLVTFHIIEALQTIGGTPEVLNSMTYPRAVSYSPFPAEPNLIPVSGLIQTAKVFSSVRNFDGRDFTFEVLGVNATALEPVAHLRKDFDIRDVRFSEHEVH